MKKILFAVFAAMFAISSPAFADEQMPEQVDGVYDSVNDAGERLNINGIEAPEND